MRPASWPPARTRSAGDIFGDAAPYFKRIIERDAQTRGLRDAYAAMQEVPAKSPPTVNALYPEKAALATVPPLILVNLPRLPDGLEYRFMGRDLILRDREANLIVDFIPGAVPVSSHRYSPCVVARLRRHRWLCMRPAGPTLAGQR